MFINLKKRENDNRWLSSTMTDISFLLIIFFLITATFVTDIGLKLNLPELDSEPTILKPNEVIVLDILNSGLILDGDVISKDQFQDVVNNKILTTGIITMIINIDDGIKYQEVLGYLDISKKLGIVNFSLKANSDQIIPVSLEDDDNEN